MQKYNLMLKSSLQLQVSIFQNQFSGLKNIQAFSALKFMQKSIFSTLSCI